MASSIGVYKRLVGYLRPYLFRLAIGIAAGFLVGGSLFGVFHYSRDVLQSLIPASMTGKIGGAGKTSPAADVPSEPVPDAVAEPVPDAVAELPDWQRFLAERFNIQATSDEGKITGAFLLLTMIGLPLAFALKALGSYLNRYYMAWVGTRVIRDIRDDLFHSMTHQSLGFYGRCDVGNLISRSTNDTALVEKAVSQTIADLSRCPIEILVCVIYIVLATIQTRMFAALPALGIAFVLVVLPIIFLGRYIKGITKVALNRISVLVSRMQETFTGIRVVKAFHMEEAELARFREINRGYFKSVIRALRAEILMNPLMELVAVLFVCIGAVYCYQTGIVIEDVVPIILAVTMAYRPIKQLAKVNASLQRSAAAADRIFELIDTDTALPEAPNPRRKETFSDRIIFDNVTFQYQPESPRILDGVSFELKRGEVIAFVGETGSGKTTVANLLARFYDATTGTISIDGIDIRDLAIADVRRIIGIVSQETILFNDTIASNIAYGSAGASRQEIIAAATQANAHEFIMENPDGYERVVGEKGFVLSGGQRQRIAIARAILRNPPILILDEATSALDTVTERLVQEALNHLMENRTVFAIAHRLSTIKHADQICLLEKGRIVERGTHDELYAREGRYRHLCDIQFS